MNSKLQKLKEIGKEKEALILSCGPSIKKFTTEQLTKLAKDKYVIAIKSAYNLIPELVDLHLFNCCNNPSLEDGKFYDYSKSKKSLFVCASSNYPPDYRIPENQRYDLFLPVPFPKHQKDFLVYNQDMDKWIFEGSMSYRPCAPGIFGESCIWFIELMKFKKFTTLGIDMCTGAGEKHEHYWTDEEAKTFKVPGHTMEWEFEANRKFSKPLYEWFKSKGIEWYIIGESCLSDDIPRIKT